MTSMDAVHWTRKDLTGIEGLSGEELKTLLDTAAAFKTVGTREIKKVPALRGQTMVNFFLEPSTRTRVSFELAALRLSADVVNVSASSSSITKGETLKDTALNLQALHADVRGVANRGEDVEGFHRESPWGGGSAEAGRAPARQPR